MLSTTLSLGIADALGHRWVQAGAALLDGGEVKPSGIGDRLQMLGGLQVGVGSRNRRELALDQPGHRLREAVAEIRVPVAGAVARPPAGVHCQLHQVRQSLDVRGPCGSAARQRPELVEVDRLGTA